MFFNDFIVMTLFMLRSEFSLAHKGYCFAFFKENCLHEDFLRLDAWFLRAFIYNGRGNKWLG